MVSLHSSGFEGGSQRRAGGVSPLSDRPDRGLTPPLARDPVQDNPGQVLGGPRSLPGPGDRPADEAWRQARGCVPREESTSGETAVVSGWREVGLGVQRSAHAGVMSACGRACFRERILGPLGEGRRELAHVLNKRDVVGIISIRIAFIVSSLLPGTPFAIRIGGDSRPWQIFNPARSRKRITPRS